MALLLHLIAKTRHGKTAVFGIGPRGLEIAANTTQAYERLKEARIVGIILRHQLR
jgi:hypothetical protein